MKLIIDRNGNLVRECDGEKRFDTKFITEGRIIQQSLYKIHSMPEAIIPTKEEKVLVDKVLDKSKPKSKRINKLCPKCYNDEFHVYLDQGRIIGIICNKCGFLVVDFRTHQNHLIDKK